MVSVIATTQKAFKEDISKGYHKMLDEYENLLGEKAVKYR